MTLVVDASAFVSLLTDAGDTGDWVRATLEGRNLVAPHILPAEVTQVLRRGVLTGARDAEGVRVARQSLVQIEVTLLDFAPVAERVWDMRQTFTAYDAWHVAVAEALDAPLVTLDAKLAAAPGPRCEFVLP